jgi:hypothetical protein
MRTCPIRAYWDRTGHPPIYRGAWTKRDISKDWERGNDGGEKRFR